MVKRMKAKEAHDLSVDELTSKLDSLKDELFKLRFQHATGQLENPARIRDVRRSIARVQTVLHERQLKQA